MLLKPSNHSFQRSAQPKKRSQGAQTSHSLQNLVFLPEDASAQDAAAPPNTLSHHPDAGSLSTVIAHPGTRSLSVKGAAVDAPKMRPALDLKSLTQIENRAVGSLLGCMCGDALGAAVEGWDAKQIAERFPEGMVDLIDTSRGYVHQRSRCISWFAGVYCMHDAPPHARHVRVHASWKEWT